MAPERSKFVPSSCPQVIVVEINPYAASSSERDNAELAYRRRNLRITGLFVLAMAVVGLFVGMAIGTAIGMFAPGFFAAILLVRGDFDPLPLGISLGAVNGVLFGAGAGVLLVAIDAWRSRRAQQERRND